MSSLLPFTIVNMLVHSLIFTQGLRKVASFSFFQGHQQLQYKNSQVRRMFRCGDNSKHPLWNSLMGIQDAKYFVNTILSSSSSIMFLSTENFATEEGNKDDQRIQQQDQEVNEVSIPSISNENQNQNMVPAHLTEGLCAVYKPMGWTSQDVVAYIRGMLERDARSRGVNLPKRRSSKSKNKVKVGHGGTLDPLATGVLVIGIGSGTKDLQQYLQGAKQYTASVELGFETDTLDMEGKRIKEMDFGHVGDDDIKSALHQFTGKIMQKPPMFSAIRKDGKRLYEQAREGMTEDDVDIEARQVEVYNLQYLPQDKEGKTLPCFGLEVECGGGTYIRSLVRDLGNALGTCATMTNLERTRQGPFTLEDAIPKEEWNPESIYAAVEKWNVVLSATDEKERV